MKKTEARKITDMVEKNTHAALRKRFPDLYDFLYACNDEETENNLFLHPHAAFPTIFLPCIPVCAIHALFVYFLFPRHCRRTKNHTNQGIVLLRRHERSFPLCPLSFSLRFFCQILTLREFLTMPTNLLRHVFLASKV